LRRPLSRKRLAGAASVLTASALALVAAPGSAVASHGGYATYLTASSPSGSKTTIAFNGRATLDAGEAVKQAAWSPDGSRAVYVNNFNGIDTIRHDSNGDWWSVVLDGSFTVTPGVPKAHPTWSGDGNAVFWSEQSGSGGAWEINGAPSAAYFPDESNLINNPLTDPADGYDYTSPDGGPNGIVFQRQQHGGVGQADVMEWTSAGGVQELFGNGAAPAISPDGTKVAFVRSDGTKNQIYTADLDGTNALQITTDASNKNNPTWSPDGATIAFNVNGVQTIATAPATGNSASSTVTGITGFPAYEPWVPAESVVRLQGSNRFGTATAISQSQWATAGDASDPRAQAKAVVLSRSDTFADAVSGSALAAAKQGPLLLTNSTTLTAATQTEITRVLGADNMSATVYILGGTGAISQSIQDALAAHYDVRRLSGSNRYETSLSIANEIDPDPTYVLAATGNNFPDALSAGTAAGAYDFPGSTHTAVVVLTNDKALPAVTKTYLDNWVNSPNAYLLLGVGSQAAIATQAYGPMDLGGRNRYETAVYVAQVMFGQGNVAGLATGTNWPDALAGGALLGAKGGPLLLANGATTLYAETAWELDNLAGSVNTAYVFGGVLPSSNDNQIGYWISGPGGYTTVTNPTPATSLNRTMARTAGGATSAHQVRTPEQIKAAATALPKH